MRTLILKEMKIVSFLEKKAKRIVFHPKMTVIKGENHTGKSSLIKSIYWTFGAEAKNLHPKWKQADSIVLIDFTIDGLNYSILRKQDFFAIFDAENNLIEKFDKITDGVGPFLSELFNYKIRLNNREGELITPPPAYFFLPFYIDQDASWKENWAAFTKLGQLSNWRDKIINYHTGIRPNEFYIKKAELETSIKIISELESKRTISTNILTKVINQINRDIVDIDIEKFKVEIHELLNNYGTLNKKGQSLKQDILNLENHKIHIEQQITILEETINDLRADFEFSIEQTNSVECPTCGNLYENSFAERFAIAKDEDKCKDLLINLKEELHSVNKIINKEYQKYNQNSELVYKIQSILEKKKGEFKLKDVIQNEGKKEVTSIIKNEIDELLTDIHNKEIRVSTLTDEIKSFDGKEEKVRQKSIKQMYFNLMRQYLLQLDVHTMQEKSFKSITSNIKESGSGLPRALLAYYYSILKVMKEFSTSTFCPIIIDSPNQQDQDPNNLRKMIKFIIEEKPDNSQIILGLVDLSDIEFDGDVIVLHEKYSLLQKYEYKELSDIIEVMLAKSYFYKEASN